ncbi:MAG: hypothetical protein KC731_41940, partial [Myxococcales bacterium]|nr:hypothetical protein [Myxococcales bacterium]
DFKHAATSYLEARDADPDLAPTVSEVEALAIAGYHHSAAEVVRFMARTWYTAPKSAERDRLVCIADALDARSGPAAADALEAFAERQQSDATPAECAYLYADLESDEEERLHRLQGGYAFADTDLRQLLIAEVTNDDYAFPHITEGYPLSAMTDPQPWIHLRPIALEMAILGRIDDIRLTHERREALAGYAAEVALFHAFMGEREKALDALAPMERFVGDAERRPFVLGAIAALHVGDVYRAEQLMDWGREDSHAIAKLRQVVKTMQREREVDFAHEIDTEPWSPNVDLFTAGKTGDGAKVALALRDFNTMGRQALPRIVPHLTRGHAALREWANDAFPGPCRSCGLSALAEHAGARREAARVIQDDTLYARMSERTQRILEGMLRRDLALVFLLLERFAEG